jgi:hypothetical protein
VIAAALLTGAATLSRRDEEPAEGQTKSMPTWARVAAVLAAGAALIASAIALTAQLELDSSQKSSRSGDLTAAAHTARAAAAIEPWAAAPRVQLALVEERAGDLRGALDAIGEAAERDREDWKIWLIAARLNVKAGDVPAGERALARSRQLNPRATIFLPPPAPG